MTRCRRDLDDSWSVFPVTANRCAKQATHDKIRAYVDTDHAGGALTRRSTAGLETVLTSQPYSVGGLPSVAGTPDGTVLCKEVASKLGLPTRRQPLVFLGRDKVHEPQHFRKWFFQPPNQCFRVQIRPVVLASDVQDLHVSFTASFLHPEILSLHMLHLRSKPVRPAKPLPALLAESIQSCRTMNRGLTLHHQSRGMLRGIRREAVGQ